MSTVEERKGVKRRGEVKRKEKKRKNGKVTILVLAKLNVQQSISN